MGRGTPDAGPWGPQVDAESCKIRYRNEPAKSARQQPNAMGIVTTVSREKSDQPQLPGWGHLARTPGPTPSGSSTQRERLVNTQNNTPS